MSYSFAVPYLNYYFKIVHHYSSPIFDLCSQVFIQSRKGSLSLYVFAVSRKVLRSFGLEGTIPTAIVIAKDMAIIVDFAVFKHDSDPHMLYNII